MAANIFDNEAIIRYSVEFWGKKGIIESGSKFIISASKLQLLLSLTYMYTVHAKLTFTLGVEGYPVNMPLKAIFGIYSYLKILVSFIFFFQDNSVLS